MHTILVTLLLSLLGLFAVVLQFYGFGLFIVQRVVLLKRPLVRFVLSWLVGIIVTSVSIFTLGKCIGTHAYYLAVVFLVIGVTQLPEVYKECRVLLTAVKKEKLFSIFAVLSSLSLYGTLGGTWIRVGDTISIQAGQLHDSVWHLAVIQKLLQSIPPIHPSSYYYSVENYHYLYDIAHAAVVWTTQLPVSILYFQVFPLIVSLLLLCSVVLLFPLRNKRVAAYSAVFLTFFGGSFGYLIPLFLPGNSWQESSFWVSQTFAVLVNPQLVFSFSVLLFLLWYLQAKQTEIGLRSWRLYFLVVGITTSLVGFKSYGWLIGMALLGIELILDLYSSHNWKKFFAQAVFLGSIGFLSMYWIIGIQTSSFIYAPLWYLSSMVEAPDRVNNPVWKLLEQHYIANQKWHRLIELKVKEFIIFYGGNLGTRVIFLFLPLVWLFRKRKHRSVSNYWIYLIAGFLIASLFPLFVLQKNGPVWNSIQFWYYALIFANCMAAAAVPFILQLLRIRILKLSFLVVFVAATIPAFIQTAEIKYGRTEPLPVALIAGVATEIQPTDRVFVCPSSDPLYKTTLIAAVSGASVFVANPVQLDILFGKTGTEMEQKAREQLRSEYSSDGRFLAFLEQERITKIACSDSAVINQLASLSQLQLKKYNDIYIFTYEQ